MSTDSREKSDTQKENQSEAIPVATPLDGELTSELLTAKNFLGYGYNRTRRTIEQEVWSVDDSHVRIGHREHIKAYAVGLDERESFEKLSAKYTFLSDLTIPVKKIGNPSMKASLSRERESESKGNSTKQCYSFVRYKKVHASIKRFPHRDDITESGDSFVKSGFIYIGYQVTMTAQFVNAESKSKATSKAGTSSKVASIYDVEANADWGSDLSRGKKASNVQISVVSHGVVLPALQTFYKDMEAAITALNDIESEFKTMISVPQPGAQFIIDPFIDLEVYPRLGRRTSTQDISRVDEDLGSWEYLSRQIQGQMQGTSKRLIELFGAAIPNPPAPALPYTSEQKEILGLSQFFKGLSEFVSRAAYDAENEDLTHKRKMMILGRSGAGKSSLVAALLDYSLGTKEIRPGQWVVDYADGVEDHPARPKIGHKKSETEGCIIYQKPGVGYAYMDCAGFKDTKGYAADINNAKAISILLERHSVECIIVVLKPENFDTAMGRGEDFIEVMKQIASLSTQTEPNNIWSSVLLVVTRPVINPENDSVFTDNRQAQAQLIRQIEAIQEIWSDDRGVSDLLGQWLRSYKDRLVVMNLKRDHAAVKDILENKIRLCIGSRVQNLGKPNIEAYYSKGLPVDQDFIEMINRTTSYFNLLHERYARYQSEIEKLQSPSSASSASDTMDEASLERKKTELEIQRRKLKSNSSPKDLLPFSSNKPVTHYYFSPEEFTFDYTRRIPYSTGRLYPSGISHLGTYREDGSNNPEDAVYKAYFSPCWVGNPARATGKFPVSDARVVVSVRTKDHPDTHVEIDELTTEIQDIEDQIRQAVASRDRKALGAEQVLHEIEDKQHKRDAISGELSAYEFFCSRLSLIIQTLKLNMNRDKNAARFNKFIESFPIERCQRKISYSSELKAKKAATSSPPQKPGFFPADIAKTMRQASGGGRHEELRQILTSNRAMIDVIDDKADKGWTALHWAIFYGQVQCVRVLIEFGAQYAIQDKSGYFATAVDVAISKNNRIILDLLLVHIKNKLVQSADKNNGKVLRNAANQGDFEAVKLLVHSGVDIDSTSPSTQQTALHIASEKKYTAIVKFLLDCGAKTDLRDSQNKCAMDCASGYEPILKIYRDHEEQATHQASKIY